MTASIALAFALFTTAGPEGAAITQGGPTPGQEQTDVPVRASRAIQLLGEAGWNSLSGVGLNLCWHVVPHVSIDLGAGISGVGNKLGARGRFNFSTAPFTPFVGVGVLRGGGTGDTAVELDTEGNVISFKLKPSVFAQLVAGIEYVGEGGFAFLATVGYAKLTGGDNVEIVSGVPTDVQQKAMDLAYGSGPTISVALGYAF